MINGGREWDWMDNLSIDIEIEALVLKDKVEFLEKELDKIKSR